jgi:hypothetical protein
MSSERFSVREECTFPAASVSTPVLASGDWIREEFAAQRGAESEKRRLAAIKGQRADGMSGWRSRAITFGSVMFGVKLKRGSATSMSLAVSLSPHEDLKVTKFCDFRGALGTDKPSAMNGT